MFEILTLRLFFYILNIYISLTIGKETNILFNFKLKIRKKNVHSWNIKL